MLASGRGESRVPARAGTLLELAQNYGRKAAKMTVVSSLAAGEKDASNLSWMVGHPSAKKTN